MTSSSVLPQRTLALLVLFSAVTLAPALAGPHRSPPPILNGAAGKRLDEAIQKLDGTKFWGSALVAKGKKVLLLRSYGEHDGEPLPTDALWDWASVSKQFTAAAVLRLAMDRKLTLDDSIRKYYPDAPEDKQPITLRHLLNHTSGMNNEWREGRPSPYQRDMYLSKYLELPVVAKPGEVWAYNNEAYSLAAAIVEKASGKKYEDYCVDKLFEPAGMKDTLFIGHPKLDVTRVPRDDRGKNRRWEYFDDRGPMGWNYRGMGGVVSSTIDVWKWHHALRGNQVLNAAAKKELYTVGKNDYALGWMVKEQNGDTFYLHTGSVGKHLTIILRSEKSDVVVALVYGYRDVQESIEETAFRLYRLALQK